jgi:acetyl-CoA carboxylase carboxyltransferase component
VSLLLTKQLSCSNLPNADSAIAIASGEALSIARSIIANLGKETKSHPWPVAPVEEPAYDPQDIYGIVPDDFRRSFDVREVIARIVDGSRFHEFKASYGATLVCGFARLMGFPVGIVANNGILFGARSCASRFVAARSRLFFRTSPGSWSASSTRTPASRRTARRW